jgi:hypothetical protein
VAIASGNTTSVAANALGSWVALGPGHNRLVIKCGTWGGSTAGLRYSDDGLDASETLLRATFGGTELAATVNGIYDLNGPGYATIRVTNYGGTPVTFSVHQIRPVLGAR